MGHAIGSHNAPRGRQPGDLVEPNRLALMGGSKKPMRDCWPELARKYATRPEYPLLHGKSAGDLRNSFGNLKKAHPHHWQKLIAAMQGAAITLAQWRASQAADEAPAAKRSRTS